MGKTIWAILLGVLLSGCATNYKNFPEIKKGMIKDEVLELVGSPQRSERRDGYEKWAYRFYGGDDNNIEKLMFVTFRGGVVVDHGVDQEEWDRRSKIQEDYKKAKQRKRMKSQKANESIKQEKAAKEEHRKKVYDTDIESEMRDLVPKDSDFVEIKSRSRKKAPKP